MCLMINDYIDYLYDNDSFFLADSLSTDLILSIDE